MIIVQYFISSEMLFLTVSTGAVAAVAVMIQHRATLSAYLSRLTTFFGVGRGHLDHRPSVAHLLPGLWTPPHGQVGSTNFIFQDASGAAARHPL
jgi:hypothetical protein